MSEKTWADVDDYFVEAVLGDDEVLAATLADNAAAGLPAIDVSATQGRFLTVLARAISASKVLEIGTLGGYSTICLARAVGKLGRVVTLEYDPTHADVARANLDRAGVGDRVDVRVGAALDSLPTVESEGLGPFDFVFIDADKENNVNYVRWALRLTHPGSMIVVDNVVRAGAVADPDTSNPQAVASREVLELFGAEPRITATALQTVGAKGWDGLAIGIVD